MMQKPSACYYEDQAYSPGAVAAMAGQVNMACSLQKGAPYWVGLAADAVP